MVLDAQAPPLANGDCGPQCLQVRSVISNDEESMHALRVHFHVQSNGFAATHATPYASRLLQFANARPAVNLPLTVVGMGSSSMGGAVNPSAGLQQITMNVISNSACIDGETLCFMPR